MSEAKFTDEQLMEELNKYPGISHRALAKVFDVDESSIRGRRKKLIKKGFSPEHNYTHLVPDGFLVKGVSQQYKEDGTLGQQWVKSSIDRDRQLEMLSEMVQSFKDELPQYKPITIMNEHEIDENLMLVLPIGDLHVGMMAWKDETGQDWSLKHVQTAVHHVFKMLIDQAPKVKKILIIDVGDFHHRDNKDAVTPAHKNQLDVDSRYPKMVRVAIQLIRYIVKLALEKAEEVELWMVPGNHNAATAVVTAECLRHVYENEPRMMVNTSPNPIKYCEWGKCMIASTHGDQVKMEILPGVCATDQSEMWGRTKFRYGMTGHIHSSNKLSKEGRGMEVESFRTLAPNDSFAAWYGYRSGQDSHAIVFHKEHGRRGRNEIGIVMVQDYLDEIE